MHDLFNDDFFISTYNVVSDEVYKTAVEKGWYEDGRRNLGEAIALMHSELSEALESLRSDAAKDSDKLSGYLGVEEELADVIIRIMDISRSEGWRIPEAILAKIAYNKTRPHKHGKKF